MNSFPQLVRCDTGRNGTIYGLVRHPGAKIPDYKRILFGDPIAEEQPQFKVFKRLVLKFHDTALIPLKPDIEGFYEDVALRHEFTSPLTGMKFWAIPERYIFGHTPLHTWCYILDEENLIFLDSAVRKSNGPIQDEFPEELQFWLNAMDALHAGLNKDFWLIPGKPGFQQSPTGPEITQRINLRKYVENDRTKEIHTRRA